MVGLLHVTVPIGFMTSRVVERFACGHVVQLTPGQLPPLPPPSPGQSPAQVAVVSAPLHAVSPQLVPKLCRNQFRGRVAGRTHIAGKLAAGSGAEIADLTSGTVAPGFCPRYSAATPTVRGEAKEVPLSVVKAVLEVLVASRTLLPGAQTSTAAPQFE